MQIDKLLATADKNTIDAYYGIQKFVEMALKIPNLQRQTSITISLLGVFGSKPLESNSGYDRMLLILFYLILDSEKIIEDLKDKLPKDTYANAKDELDLVYNWFETKHNLTKLKFINIIEEDSEIIDRQLKKYDRL